MKIWEGKRNPVNPLPHSNMNGVSKILKVFEELSLLRSRTLQPLITHYQCKPGKFFLVSGSDLLQLEGLSPPSVQMENSCPTFPSDNPSRPGRRLSHAPASLLQPNDAFKPASKSPFSTPLIISWSSLSFSVSFSRMWMPHWNVVVCSLTINWAIFSACQMSLSFIREIQSFYQHAKGWGLAIPFTVDPAKVCGCSRLFWRLEAFSNPNPRSVLRKICRPTTSLPPYCGFGSQSVVQGTVSFYAKPPCTGLDFWFLCLSHMCAQRTWNPWIVFSLPAHRELALEQINSGHRVSNILSVSDILETTEEDLRSCWNGN